ncbi:hypothetical protein BCAH1134_C0428 (plasmid) [Bacillus cereus AH1134]|nr:hypothetical protein BCAH1134_C0428 [Bacillus cereus AH1134]
MKVLNCLILNQDIALSQIKIIKDKYVLLTEKSKEFIWSSQFLIICIFSSNFLL